MQNTGLSNRSERKTLPAAVSGESIRHSLLAADGDGDAWRIIEAFSLKGRPFELEARWTAATSGGAWVKVTVAHATRLCVFARSLQLQAINLSDAENPVVVTVADGFTHTANGWEHRDHCDGVEPVKVLVPPFASFYHLHLAERSALAGAEITVFDGLGTARARFSAANQPSGGIPMGGAGRLEILTGESTDLRGIFELLM